MLALLAPWDGLLSWAIAHPYPLGWALALLGGTCLGAALANRAWATRLLRRLEELPEDSKTGRWSSKRVVLLMAGASLSWAAIVLAHSAAGGNPTVTGTMWAVTIPLGGMAGWSYVRDKMTSAGVPGVIPSPAPPDPGTGAAAPDKDGGPS